jgi:hypothetical protein
MQQVWQVFPSTYILIAGAKTLYAEQLAGVLAKLSPADREKVILRYDFPDQEKPWMFAALDILAYPSGYESFGIAYIEAWAVEKPVIGCKNGAVPSVIDAGRDGLLIQFDNSDMLAEALLVLLNNPAWAHSLGAQGRLKVVTRYNWPEIGAVFASSICKRLMQSDPRMENTLLPEPKPEPGCSNPGCSNGVTPARPGYARHSNPAERKRSDHPDSASPGGRKRPAARRKRSRSPGYPQQPQLAPHTAFPGAAPAPDSAWQPPGAANVFGLARAWAAAAGRGGCLCPPFW